MKDGNRDSGCKLSPGIPSQKERVGGSGGLGPSRRGHAHQGLGHGHGGRDPHIGTHPTDPHSRHYAAYGGHSYQGDHAAGLSGHGGVDHGFSHASKPGGHGADSHLVEGRRSWLAHLEGIGVGC